ncbi:LrgB family protein [Aestuariibacter sp. GS-14]|uniref:LrgB family protein n=1 Tax=Aestuariibacter sp. GS-14 TaxID=2590670 RepID=UPI001126348F|nr:LrgB family protein [Aestuariibacter sp. GS-14]TPV62210.1 LrgB family protein [Aestuariibacter sp. GS-14]
MNHDALQLTLNELLEVVQNTLSLHSVIWLAITLLIYAGAVWLFRRLNNHPLIHPLTITAVGIALLLTVTSTPVEQYRLDTSLLHWLLGPATVALAVPLFNHWQRIRQLGWPLVISVAAGGIIAPVLAWWMVYAFDAPMAIQLTMLVKSITSPLAMETGAMIGGIPALAAVFVIITGIVGALAAPLTYKLLNVTQPEAQGVALGSVCHAVGTAKALHMGEVQGALATVGLCLNGVMTAVVLPLLL